MARIVCVGLACLDYLFKVDHLPAGGGKIFAENYVAALGGPAAVASIAAAALGHDAVFLGRLGDDDVGRELTARMVRCRVDVSGIPHINRPILTGLFRRGRPGWRAAIQQLSQLAS